MASIQGIYVALFGRPADPAGLAYFNDATNNGANLDAIGDLAATAEYQNRFAGMTNEQIVNSIYQSLFERDGEKAGVDFYVGELEAGRLNINNIAIAILDGAQNDDLATVNAKIAAANIFTSHLDLQVEKDAYSGSTAGGVGHDFLDVITKDNPGTEAGADAAILKLFPDQGQEPGTGGVVGGGASSHPGEVSYGNGDVLLLNDSKVIEHYTYDAAALEMNPIEAIYNTAGQAFIDANELGGNTVLIKNLDPASEIIQEALGPVTEVVAKLLPKYDGWTPDTIFLGVPGADTNVKGTSGDDIALFLGNGSNHEFTGGRGNDVIIVADLNMAGGPVEVGSDIQLDPVNLDTMSAQNELGKPFFSESGHHIIDGGAGQDIILNIGGDHNTVSGGADNDIIASIGPSQDTISGGAGNDWIFGGPDAQILALRTADTEKEWTPFDNGDVLSGGSGADNFVYSAEGTLRDSYGSYLTNFLGNGNDTITDFKSGMDKIVIISDAPKNGETQEIGFESVNASTDHLKTFGEAFDAATTYFQENADHSHEPLFASAVQADEPNDINVFVVRDLNNDSYVFVDDNVDGGVDFTIKLDNVHGANGFSKDDIAVYNINDIGNAIMGILQPNELANAV